MAFFHVPTFPAPTEEITALFESGKKIKAYKAYKEGARAVLCTGEVVFPTLKATVAAVRMNMPVAVQEGNYCTLEQVKLAKQMDAARLAKAQKALAKMEIEND